MISEPRPYALGVGSTARSAVPRLIPSALLILFQDCPEARRQVNAAYEA